MPRKRMILEEVEEPFLTVKDPANGPIKLSRKAKAQLQQIDPECHSLVKALNQIPGIKTHESCCGHGERPFRIWFMAEDLDCLPNLLFWFDSCHCGCRDWKVIAGTDCGKSPVHFMIEGPTQKEGYRQARKIARLIRDDLAGMEAVRQQLSEERTRRKQDAACKSSG